LIGASVTFGEFFKGIIDEVSLYNRALTADEIQSIYNADSAGKCKPPPPGCVTPPAGLVAWWPGDGHANDVVGGHNGTLLSGTTFDLGKVGQSFSFDGVSRRVMVPDSDAFKLTNSLTIEGWIYIKSTTAFGTIFLRGDNRPGLDPYMLAFDPGNGGRLSFLVN